jgi:hypothetical protein
LEPSLTPAAGCNLLKEVLLGSTHILRTPEPSVTIKDLSAEMIDFELSYSVADVSAVDHAQNELFDKVYRAAAAAGAKFSPRLAGSAGKTPSDNKGESGIPERLLAGISLFSTLAAPEKAALASQMQRKDYKPGEVPLLKARPNMAEELSESLASRQLANRTVLDSRGLKEQHEEGLADRVAANIRRLFSLH